MQNRIRGVLASSGLVGVLGLGLAAVPTAADAPRFSPWSTPVNLGAVVNDAVNSDAGAFISKDGLSLFFGAYNRPDGYGQFDLYVSHRDSLDDPWGAPQNLGPSVNTAYNEQTPALSIDRHRLYFASDNPGLGGFGGMDLYVSRRHDNRDDLNWSPPANLGAGVNSPYVELGPAYFADDLSGTVILYFGSSRPGLGFEDIYASVLQSDDTFGPAERVVELSTSARESRPAIRRDGLEIFFDSNRPGTETVGGLDLWVATRPNINVPWSAPVNLGAQINTTFNDVRPSISWDGTELYFHSFIEGGGDLYRCTRTKITGRR